MNRIEELTSEIIKKIEAGEDPKTYISACLRSIQGEAESSERQRIADENNKKHNIQRIDEGYI